MSGGQIIDSRNYTVIENTRRSTMAVYNYTVDASPSGDGIDDVLLALALVAYQIILDL